MSKKYIISLVSIALLFFSCSNEWEMPENGQDNVSLSSQYVTVGASVGRNTRLAVTDADSVFKYAWDSDDTFTVLNSTTDTQGTTFRLSDGSGTNVAQFTSTVPASFTDGSTIYAFYNGNQSINWDDNGNIVLSIDDQDGTLTDKYQYMFGKTTYEEDGETNFSFNHLVSIIKVKMKMPAGISGINKLSLGSSNRHGAFTTKAKLVMNKLPNDSEGLFSTGDLVFPVDEIDYSHPDIITIDRTFTVDSDNTITAYFYVLGADQFRNNSNSIGFSSIESGVLATDDQGNQFVSTVMFDGKRLNPGEIYELDTEMYQLEDFANESQVWGGQTDPYEISNARQLYTFMLRASHELVNRYGNSYSGCSYKLMSDIVLNDEVVWFPAQLGSSIFDGNDHSIKGNITMDSSLFGNVDNSTIKNLTFEANRSQDDQLVLSTSIFCNRLYHSTLYHCINKSDMALGEHTCGFLVENMQYGSSMILCANEGNITSFAMAKSGLVGDVWGGDCLIDGCYNSGSIEVSIPWASPWGGIVGRTNGTVTIQNCWVRNEVNVLENQENEMVYTGVAGYTDQPISIRRCYWPQNSTNKAVYEDYGNSHAIDDCDTFTGTCPTASQIDALNQGIEKYGSGLEFKPDGKLRSDGKTGAPSFTIEKWY